MRFETSRTTSPATERTKAEVRLLLEPRNRTKIGFMPETIGDILDLAPPAEPCRVRMRWYRASDGRGGIFSEPCGKNTCAQCVVPYLVERISPAYGMWNPVGLAGTRKADLLEYQARSKQDHRRPYKLRGPDATPGVLSISDGQTVAVYMPGGDLCGSELERELLQRVRALPLAEPSEGAGQPSDAAGFLRPWVTNDDIRLAAAEVGGEIHLNAHGRWVFEGWTPDQNSRFVWLLRR